MKSKNPKVDFTSKNSMHTHELGSWIKGYQLLFSYMLCCLGPPKLGSAFARNFLGSDFLMSTGASIIFHKNEQNHVLMINEAILSLEYLFNIQGGDTV